MGVLPAGHVIDQTAVDRPRFIQRFEGRHVGIGLRESCTERLPLSDWPSTCRGAVGFGVLSERSHVRRGDGEGLCGCRVSHHDAISCGERCPDLFCCRPGPRNLMGCGPGQRARFEQVRYVLGASVQGGVRLCTTGTGARLPSRVWH